ncbi:MAG TPA: phosphoglycerate dehydrogenase [Blastocatellia bacterium]|nr:phosphoglycerate dehydrogenase [Blastocatellia bacterium]
MRKTSVQVESARSRQPQTTQTSYPRSKMNILLLEGISDAAVREFGAGGYAKVERIFGSLGAAELVRAVRGVHVLGIRSKTHVTRSVLEAADKLLAVGCFCIGVNQVDLKAATERGVAVFNAPHANTRSVAELVIGLCVMLIRKIPDKNAAAHGGLWLKESAGSFELRGKTLGIIGYGNIGSQVSILAEAMGMKVIYYDIAARMPHGNAKQVRELKELLKISNIVTLHVPADASTRSMINAETLKLMRRGSMLINYSRGDVVDLNSLSEAIKAGRISGAAVDVFPNEPERSGESFACPLQNLPNVILTPHIGGSTEEAQGAIGRDVVTKLIKYVELGSSEGSQTVPQVSLPPRKDTHRILHIHRNIPGVLGEINSRLSKRGFNILGQYLKTNDEIGYVILDVDHRISREAFELLKDVEGTVKARMVY